MTKFKSISKDRRITRIVLASILLLGLLFFSLFNPLNYPITSCGFKNIFGIPCPSCGLSRSVFSFSHFHFQEAFGYNLMGPILLFISIIIFTLLMFEAISGKKITVYNFRKTRIILIFIFFTIWLGTWILAILS